MQLVLLVIRLAFAALRSSKALVAENLMLRHQLVVLQRSVGRPQLRLIDRLLWAAGLRHLPDWKSCLVIVQPETVMREATRFGSCPKFLIHDNDARFGGRFDRVIQHMGIRPVSTPFRAPLANAICERVIGTLRREVLDHTLIWNVRHLVLTLRQARRWYNEARPHQTLDQQTPRGYTPPEEPVPPSDVVSISVLGGLHHEYRTKAA